MPGSGNREVIEDENNSTLQEVSATSKEDKIEIPFKKPVMLQEHMKTTSIKDVLEKHKPNTPQEKTTAEEKQITPQTDTLNSTEHAVLEENIISAEEKSSAIQIEENTDILSEQNTKEIPEVIFATLKDCWEEAIKEAATEDTIIAEGLLLKQIPIATEDNIIEIEVPNEVAKQEIRQILPILTQCLLQKTGIPYSIEVKVVKVEQEKQVDKSNPDEKFKHLCQENPKLLEFKQRLNLSIS